MIDDDAEYFWAEDGTRSRNPARWASLGVLAALLVPAMWGVVADTGAGDLVASVTESVETPAPSVGSLAPLIVAGATAQPVATAVAPTVPGSPASGAATIAPAPSAIETSAAESSTANAALTTADSQSAGTTAESVEPTAKADEPPATEAPLVSADSRPPQDAPAPEMTAAVTCAKEYTVGVGDFWIRIADESGTRLADLLRLNGATARTPMYPGGTICLPAGARVPSLPATTPPSTNPPSTTPRSTAPSATNPRRATTTTTTTTTTTQPRRSYGRSEVEQIIRDVWPDDLEDRALEIAWRESNHRPDVRNYCCYGLFQIYWEVHRSWLAGLGVTSSDQLYDPAVNARAAYTLYQRAGGWGPWT